MVIPRGSNSSGSFLLSFFFPVNKIRIALIKYFSVYENF